ncbi:MAG: magnesium chelatase [Acidobacteria bacterium]|nr:magnesium chelatase [Acidobacteriota bacterium]
MTPTAAARPATLGHLNEWLASGRVVSRGVKDELRANLIARLRTGEALFPGVHGYDDTVTPRVVNAVLARHNFILLGLRGQAKTRLIRMLATLLDEWIPYVAGSEIRDDPWHPISAEGRSVVGQAGEEAPIAWLHRDQRYVEKLATPDVTIADMIGDIDPIKAARSGRDLANEHTIHYGLLPRANRGIFAINELPDLAGKIQVGLFNIMQEGDIQIKGYPVRLPLDLMLVFTANPEDYTARGKIITPLKDRIGSEIRTHYPLTVEHGIAITSQEAWTSRGELPNRIPAFIREITEQVAFLGREDKKVDKRSGVSQRLPISLLETIVSNAERRGLAAGEDLTVPRVTDVHAALPAITGKIELEYEGELRGGEAVARELVRQAVAKTFTRYFEGVNFGGIVQWFELGGTLRFDDASRSDEMANQLNTVQGLMEKTGRLGLTANEPDAVRASAGEFILEGLCALRRLTRHEELGFTAEARKPAPAAEPAEEPKPGRRPPKDRSQLN